MALITRFSVEELAYLNGLPEFDDPMEHHERRLVGWSCGGPRNIWSDGAEVCAERGCAIASHKHGGATYVRHGEVIARSDGGASFRGWLDACHAHEEALR